METPVNVELRPITPEDLREVHGVVRRSEAKDNEPLVTPFDEVVSEYEAPFFDPVADSRLAVNGQGQVVAWAKIWYWPSTASTAPIWPAASTRIGDDAGSAAPSLPGSCSGARM
jgi:hypothetical protein